MDIDFDCGMGDVGEVMEWLGETLADGVSVSGREWGGGWVDETAGEWCG